MTAGTGFKTRLNSLLPGCAWFMPTLLLPTYSLIPRCSYKLSVAGCSAWQTLLFRLRTDLELGVLGTKKGYSRSQVGRKKDLVAEL